MTFGPIVAPRLRSHGVSRGRVRRQHRSPGDRRRRAGPGRPASRPVGHGLTQDGKARIRVEKCGPQEKNLCGYAVWLKVPNNDEGNAAGRFPQSRPEEARPPLARPPAHPRLKLNEDARYEGKIYNAEDGKF